MSRKLDSDLRLELARQHKAELVQQAERDQLRRALSAEIADDAGRRPNPLQLIRRLRRNRQASKGGSVTVQSAPKASHMADDGTHREAHILGVDR